MKYFCQRCGAQADGHVNFCPNCLGINSFLPVVSVAVQPQEGAVSVTARELLVRGKIPVADVFCLGKLPAAEVITAMLHGPPGSGKTTLMLLISQSLLQANRGPVLFVQVEEGFSESLREKLQRLEIWRDDLHFTIERSWDYLLPLLAKLGIRWLVIDSCSMMNLGKIQSSILQRAGISLMYSLHEQKSGQGYKGDSTHGHLADIVIRTEDFKWGHEKSRFSPCGKGVISV